MIPQILPGSADEFRLLTDAVGEKGYRQIDINLGCPFPMIAGKHKGAGMLLYPAQVAEVLAPGNSVFVENAVGLGKCERMHGVG